MPLLFAYGINRFSHDVNHILFAWHAFKQKKTMVDLTDLEKVLACSIWQAASCPGNYFINLDRQYRTLVGGRQVGIIILLGTTVDWEYFR